MSNENAQHRSQTRAEAARARRAERQRRALSKGAGKPRRNPFRDQDSTQRAKPAKITRGRTFFSSHAGTQQLAPRPTVAPRRQQRSGPSVATIAGTLVGDIRPSWRWASVSVVLLYLGVLAYFLTSPAYFVESIKLDGARYANLDAIYEVSGVHYLHMFWLDPAAIEANVSALPGIESTMVDIAWPHEITISISEREPVLTWTQGGNTVWVDAEGRTFRAWVDRPDLLPITVDDATAPITPGGTVPVPAVNGALLLKALRPNIELLHYSSEGGLSYQDGRGWRGYFGVGLDMETKLRVYEEYTERVVATRETPVWISVVDPEHPTLANE